MDRRGFIRTLEAVIAVILVFVFVYYVGDGYDRSYRSVESIKSLQESILGEISKNDDFRDCIVVTPVDEFNDAVRKGSGEHPCVLDIVKFIEESLPTRFKGGKHKFNICDPDSCNLPELGKGGKVYTSAVIITSSLKSNQYSPRILRLWLY